MGIFRKSARSQEDLSNTTIIAAGTKIKGEIKGQCKVRVDGEFSGPISSTGVITVGKSGLIQGNIAAEELIVGGDFSGNADCREIQILAGGRVIGRTTCSVLVIERGGAFDGENKIKDSALDANDYIGNEMPLKVLDDCTEKVTGISEGSPMIQVDNTFAN